MPSYTYITPLPVGSNNPGVDRPNMTTNTASIANIVNQDLVGFGQSNGGLHRQASMYSQSAPGLPGGTNPPVTGVYYVNDNGVSQPSPFFQNATYANLEIMSAVASSLTQNGYIRFLDGLIIQWGYKSPAGSGGSVTFPLAFPSGNAPFAINATVIANSGNFLISINSSPAPSATTFNYDSTTSTPAFYWIAIGK